MVIWNDVLGRLELAIEALSTRHVSGGFTFDRELADRALAYVADLAAGKPSAPHLDGVDPLIEFAIQHRVSTDWLLLGDVRPMICQAAGAIVQGH
jgi:hypothetical protein